VQRGRQANNDKKGYLLEERLNYEIKSKQL